MRAVPRAMASAAALAAAFASVADAAEPETAEPGFELTLGARAGYDDNLYRLPDFLDPELFAGPGATREDSVQRLSAGIEQHWQWSRQKLGFDLNAVQSRYEHNDRLDNTSGSGRAEWEWHAGRLGGSLGGDYARGLASFTNTRFLQKDMLETSGAFAKLSLRVGPSLALRANARHAETEHGASQRSFDDSQLDSASIGVRWINDEGNEIGVDARRSEVTFDQGFALGGDIFQRDYEDQSAHLVLTRIVSPRTRFETSVGYLWRDYLDPRLAEIDKGSFAGVVGEAQLDWQASNKVELSLGAWRKPRAYLDAESDYFVATGVTLAPGWTPTPRISLSMEFSYEEQDYLGTSLDPLVPRRRDQVASGTFRITYTAWRKLQFDISARAEQRESDRVTLEYDSQVASIGVRWHH